MNDSRIYLSGLVEYNINRIHITRDIPFRRWYIYIHYVFSIVILIKVGIQDIHTLTDKLGYRE